MRRDPPFEVARTGDEQCFDSSLCEVRGRGGEAIESS